MNARSFVIDVATPEEMAELEQMRAPDVAAGPADRRMARYLRLEHHPGYAGVPRVVMIAREADSSRQIPAGEALGYIGGHRTERFDCEGELQYLYVAPSARRTGVASALLAELWIWFRHEKIHRICVDVEPSNRGARAFYRSHGAVDLNPHWLVWPDISNGPAAQPEFGTQR